MKTEESIKYSHRESQRKYKASLKGHQTELRYRSTDTFKLANRRHRLKILERLWIYSLVRRQLKKGNLLRKPCFICGNTYSLGHHDDYAKPLDVQWFCHKHHAEQHKRLAVI